MEFVAWAMHKYVMHGFLWVLHEDHHVRDEKPFEKNDIFFLIFAIPSWLLMMLGSIYESPVSRAFGWGILVYGVAYTFIHEIVIHQRIKWFTRTDNVYLRAIRKAHKVHHKKLGKEDGECFGMLIVPWKFFREALQYKRKQKTARG
ncbi:MAG: carotene hydroxylase [Cryomorphaceae bacterium]|nr:MAG: carotene hydroxylase [Cryomorphaceae bacterium]